MALTAEQARANLAKVEWPRPCKVCGVMFDNLGSLGSHARKEHPKPPKEKKDKDWPPRNGDAPKRPATPVSAASAIVHAGEPTSEAAKRKPPTSAEWREKLGLTLALITLWMVMRLVARSDLRDAPDEIQDAYTDRLAMGDDEVDAIVDPFVALISGPLGGVNKKYGRAGLEVLGVAPATLAMVTWRSRVRDFEREHCAPRGKRKERPRHAPDPGRADGGEGAPAFAVPYLNGSIGHQEETAGVVPPHPG